MSEDRGIDEPRMQPLYFGVFPTDDYVHIKISVESASLDEGMQQVYDLCAEWLRIRNRDADIAKIAKLGAIQVAHQMPMTEDQINVARGVAAECERDLVESHDVVWPHGGDAMQCWDEGAGYAGDPKPT